MVSTSSAMPTHTHVELPSFDGPLALLLELVERDKVSVASISVQSITAAYLERVAQMDQVQAGDLVEFIQLGSRLNYIKSLALLPDKNEEKEELAALEHDLSEYRRYREAAEHLQTRLQTMKLWPKGSPYEIPTTTTPNVSLAQLSSAFTLALKRTKPLGPTISLQRHLDIKDIIKNLLSRLASEPIQLHTIIEECNDRLEIIVTFLALLELIKSKNVVVTQASQFEPIAISLELPK
jgi:segregation and condensation protein A